MLEQFHFLRSELLWLIVPVFYFAWRLWHLSNTKNHWFKWVQAPFANRFLMNQNGSSVKPLSAFLLWLGLLLVFAVAGPAWERLPSAAYKSEQTLFFVLDLSPSMNLEKSFPTPLSDAVHTLKILLREAKEGNFAFVVFSGDAFMLVPQTHDPANIDLIVEGLTPELMPLEGDLVTPALRLVYDYSQTISAQRLSMIVISDGVEDIDAALPWLDKLTAMGMRISTIDVLRPGVNAAASLSAKKQSISRVSAVANGVSIDSSSSPDDLLAVLSPKVDRSIHDDESRHQTTRWQDRGALLVLLTLPMVLYGFRRGLIVSWSMTVLMLATLNTVMLSPAQAEEGSVPWWSHKNMRAQELLTLGAYGQAAELFEDPAWRATALYLAQNYSEAGVLFKKLQTADGFYNAGNALAYSGQYDKAFDAYRRALAMDPEHEDAQYNMAVIERVLDKQQAKKSPPKQSNQTGVAGGASSGQGESENGVSKSSDNLQGAGQQTTGEEQRDPKDAASQAAQSQNNMNDVSALEANKKAETRAAIEGRTVDSTKQLSGRAAITEQDSLFSEEEYQQKIANIKSDPAGLIRRKLYRDYQQRQLAETQQSKGQTEFTPDLIPLNVLNGQ
ncbi:MAG TPA: hypothetical protein DCZ03_02075 [Gammaproteobacteria bacterium]|nr:hypothetical protein [Gammaproteobacteria bacterium]